MLVSRSLFTPTALALALTTALAPLAAAEQIDPFARGELSHAPARELVRTHPSAPVYRMTRIRPVTPAPPPVDAPPHTGFAQPPTGWNAPISEPMPPDDEPTIRPPVIVTKSTVRAALEEARAKSLAAFKTYFTAKVYPSNTYTKGALNVWRDEEGHYCAAATMIRLSGRIAISEDVANTDNNLRLINVKDGVLMDWILTSGLTQQEIDRIQLPFIGVQPEERRAPVWGGNVDPAKKAAETARLQKAYRATYAALQKNSKASLDVAVSRLMAHPQLARELLDGTLAARDIH